MTGTNLPAPELTPISLPAVQALLRRAAIFLGEHHPDLSEELRESANRLGLTIHSMTTSVESAMNGLGRIATDAGRVVVMVEPTAEEPEHAPYFLGQEPA